MKIDKFPLVDNYPSEATREAVQRVWDTAHRTAKANRGDQYNRKDVIRHTMEELYFLYDLARGEYDTLDGYIFQAGVLCGGSACVLASALKDARRSDKPVIGVDVFRKASWSVFGSEHEHWPYMEARQNTMALNLHDWLCLSMCFDVVFAEFLKTGFRIIVLDSDHKHKHVLRQLNVMIPLVVDNGFMVIHDYYETHCGVKQAVDEYFDSYDKRRFQIYDFERPVHDTSNRFIVVKFEDGL